MNVMKPRNLYKNPDFPENPERKVSSPQQNKPVNKTLVLFITFCGLFLYTFAQNFTTPIAITQVKDDKRSYGFIKHDGTVVADFIYYRARNFSEGLAAIRDYDGLWGFIDTTGKRVITMPRGVSEVGDFKEGLCWFRDRSEDLVGFIDRQGNVVLEPQWGFAQNFNDGLAAVGKAKTLGNMRNITGLTGYIDHNGKLVISVDQTHNYRNFGSEGFNCRRAVIEYFGTVTIIDPSGKTIVERPEYTAASAFSEGLCAVNVATNWPCGQDDKQPECISKWGFIDTIGNMVIKPQFESKAAFAEGVCAVETSEGKYIFIDHTGRNVLGRLFADAEPFNEGIAYVEELDGTKGYIDHEGKIVVPLPEDYTTSGTSHGGLIEISQTRRGNVTTYNAKKMINHKGEEVWINEWLEWNRDDE